MHPRMISLEISSIRNRTEIEDVRTEVEGKLFPEVKYH